jgi:hypothetical protein
MVYTNLQHFVELQAWTEPRLPSKGKGATRNTHARRKLPLSLLDDDSQVSQVLNEYRLLSVTHLVM